MLKGKYRVLFILLCALAGISLGVGVGFSIAGLSHLVGIFLLSIGTVLAMLLFAISVTLILLLGVAAHKADINDKVTAPYFAKPTRVQSLEGARGVMKRHKNCRLLLLSYYDPKENERGGLLGKAAINSKIEAFFQDRPLFFEAPDQFAFFLVDEELYGFHELVSSLSRKLKKDYPSLRLLGGLSEDKLGKDYKQAYYQAKTALFDRFMIRESASIVSFEELNQIYFGVAGLNPIAREYTSKEGETIHAFPYGYNGVPVSLAFLGGIGLTETYEEAMISLAREELGKTKEKVAIFIAPSSLFISGIYLRLSQLKDKKRLIVFLPAGESERLSYATKKIKRLGCRIGYYGLSAVTPLLDLDLEGSYLLLEEAFYEEEPSLLRAKKRLFATSGALTLGEHKDDTFKLGGEGK